MYLVQSVIFDKSKFSSETARKWLLDNKYKDKGVDEKKKFWRFRQLNPLTIKRKGYSHYITKPLDHSGVELIIAYKDKLEGAGKLNQIKKTLFKHFKSDEKLEKEVASVLTKANKETDDLLKIFEQHDKVDDKPQAQIKKQLSKLKNNYIYMSGKGLKGKSSIYSKDKMTQQEAKMYMCGIMNTGGTLDLSQDLAFRLKYSFKVGELKKMLKELSVEGRITLTPKEIRKLKKQEIIDMVVEGKLINPPELPTKVALAKKFKVADLKKEALEHAKTVDDSKTFLSSIRKLKKADLINYIDLNQLYAVAEVQPNIQLSIEELPKKKSKKAKAKVQLVIEEDEPEIVASLPSGNPKAQMKGIQIGNKVMPNEVSDDPDFTPFDTSRGDVNLDLTNDELLTLRKGDNMFSKIYDIAYKNKTHIGRGMDYYSYVLNVDNQDYGLINKRVYLKLERRTKKDGKVEVGISNQAQQVADFEEMLKLMRTQNLKKVEIYPFKTLELADGMGNSYSYVIFKEDAKYYYYFTDILVDNDADQFLSTRFNEDGKMELARFDKTKKRFKKDEFHLVHIISRGTKKFTVKNSDGREFGELFGKDQISAFFANPDNSYLPKLKDKKVKPKKTKQESEPEEDVIQEVPEDLVKEYIEKGYVKVDAVEAVKRDMQYSKVVAKLMKGKTADSVVLPLKPLTAKEKGDEREASYFLQKAQEAKNDPALMAKYKERQAKLLPTLSYLPPEILRVMIYENFKSITDLPKVFKFLDDERGYPRVYLK